MNDTLLGAMIGVGGALLAVLIGGALTGWQTILQQRRDRQSVRALLSLELLQNATKLLTVRTSLQLLLDDRAYPDARQLAQAFLVTAIPLSWDHQRWFAPEVGRHLTPSELLRIGEWYTKLDGLTFLHARALEQLRQLSRPDGGRTMTPPAFRDYVRQMLQGVLEYANELYAHPPNLPDAKMNRGETVKEYLEDLRRRLQHTGEAEESSAPDTP